MDASASEMIVYGYLPLMVSAQCVNQTLRRCSQKEETRMLVDRCLLYTSLQRLLPLRPLLQSRSRRLKLLRDLLRTEEV